MGKQAKSDVTLMLEQRRHKVAGDFAKRHPERARAERRLKQANEAVQRNFGHKVNGTPETHAQAARTVQGSLARMFVAGHISADQLAAAGEITAVVERIGRDVHVRTVSLETRVDGGGARDAAFWESLRAVRAEVAYGEWRVKLIAPEPVLAMIIDDVGVSVAAKRWRMRNDRARGLLTHALDMWGETIGEVVKQIDRADVDLAHARIGVAIG